MANSFSTFKEAKKIVKSFGFTSLSEWAYFAKTELRPKNIPSNPWVAYSKDKNWCGILDFLGVKRKTVRKVRKTVKRNFLRFEEARDLVRKLGLKNQAEWCVYSKTKRPKNIPSNPFSEYSGKGWNGIRDFIGAEKNDLEIKTEQQKNVYCSFEEARSVVRAVGLCGCAEWNIYSKTKKPENIPPVPDIIYANKWNGWDDFTGNDGVTFDDLKTLAKEIGIKSRAEWRKYCKESVLELPYSPDKAYKNKWENWGNFLGKE